MSRRTQTIELRMELLRLRAAVERAELAAAVVQMRASTRGMRALAAMVGEAGQALATGRGGWIGIALEVLRLRPWLAPVALAAVRALRRHPALMISATAVAGFFAARWLRATSGRR